MQDVYNEVRSERDYQESKWGTRFDDTHSPYHWAAFLNQYATRHLIGDPASVSIEQFRKDMIKVAATAIAAVQAIDRAKE